MRNYDKDGLLYHRYRFNFYTNIKVFVCRLFGHRINKKEDHEWCNRCGLAYEEIYHKQRANALDKAELIERAELLIKSNPPNGNK
jgi:hypothetical protein